MQKYLIFLHDVSHISYGADLAFSLFLNIITEGRRKLNEFFAPVCKL